MLVVTRKEGEKIYIGENVCVTVVRINGGTVRIGIEAAEATAIVRGELLERVMQENNASDKSAS